MPEINDRSADRATESFAARYRALLRRFCHTTLNGKVAVEAFQQHLVATHRAGLMNAVNMDTGYVNLLTPSGEDRGVALDTRMPRDKTCLSSPGAYIEDQSGDVVALYRQQIDAIVVRRCNPDPVSDCSSAWASPPAEKAADLQGGLPRLSACAGLRTGPDVCAQRRNLR